MKYTPEMAGSGQFGICAKCGLPPTPEGHDGCLGTLPEFIVMNACCGHGNDQQAYVQFWDKSGVRGEEAIKMQSELKARGSCFCTGWCKGKNRPNDPPTFTGVDQMRNVIGD